MHYASVLRKLKYTFIISHAARQLLSLYANARHHTCTHIHTNFSFSVSREWQANLSTDECIALDNKIVHHLFDFVWLNAVEVDFHFDTPDLPNGIWSGAYKNSFVSYQ